MESDFNNILNRRSTPATKWLQYDSDVLPFWVADMDFKSATVIIESLQKRINHGVFGYEKWPEELKGEIITWFHKRYGWKITEKSIVFIPGVVPGFHWAVRKYLNPGDAIVFQSPVYPPIYNAAGVCGVKGHDNALKQKQDGSYYVDFDDLEHKLKQNAKMFILCNPHNPVGRVFKRKELEKMATLCLENKVIICSDEIHGDLVFQPHKHIPIGSLDPEIASHSITLHAPSKTFNIAGLKCAYAVIPNPVLRHAFTRHMGDMLGDVNLLGYTAALAAYQSGEKWLDDLLDYLEHNRATLFKYVNEYLPGINAIKPEGTYLAWLDCSTLKLNTTPHKFFLESARIALNDGATFGPGGRNFIRFNFGCPSSMLIQGLERMRDAISTLKQWDK